MAKNSMTGEAEKLLMRSQENLLEMDLLLDNGLYFGAVNRAYYALFHAISSLVLLDGKQFSSHRALISYFGKHYAKADRVPKEYHRILLDAYAIRQRADYDYDAVVSKEVAEEICMKAKDVVKFVEKRVNGN